MRQCWKTDLGNVGEDHKGHFVDERRHALLQGRLGLRLLVLGLQGIARLLLPHRRLVHACKHVTLVGFGVLGEAKP